MRRVIGILIYAVLFGRVTPRVLRGVFLFRYYILALGVHSFLCWKCFFDVCLFVRRETRIVLLKFELLGRDVFYRIFLPALLLFLIFFFALWMRGQ